MPCAQEVFQDIFELKPALNGNVYDFSISHNDIDTSNIIDIHKYSMEKQDII